MDRFTAGLKTRRLTAAKLGSSRKFAKSNYHARNYLTYNEHASDLNCLCIYRVYMKQLFYAMPIGMRYMILSAMGFSLMAACVKQASLNGIPVAEIVAFRALVSLVLSYLDVRRKNISIFGNNKPLLIARGLVGSFALACVYYSVTHMPLANATVLQYLHPVFTAMLAVWLLKEALHSSLIVSIAFSFSGMLIIARPDWLFADMGSDIPDLALFAAVAGAFSSAIAYVLVRKLSSNEDPSVIIFYFPLVTLPFAMLLIGDNFVLPDLTTFVLLLGVGVFTQIGQIGLTKGMQTEPAGRATAFSYLQVIFAAGLGWAFFGEVPDIWVWFGAALIMTGAMSNMLWR